MRRGDVLVGLARAAIAERFFGPSPVQPSHEPWLDEPRAVFVTLKKHGALRGCIGQLTPRAPLADAVQDAACAAAFDDPRFLPLQKEELPELRIEVSVLSPLEPLDVQSEQQTLQALRPGVDGLVLTWGRRSAVFIPEMWKELPDKRDFLTQLRRKGRLPLDAWPDGLTVERFTADCFHEAVE
ncbi:MAG: AmmeMemoRadiSam system protein A [Myxococcaceae bacterium]|nr:AmmeMemoRadiSam system protein A [Myxococcaceae bacterium]